MIKITYLTSKSFEDGGPKVSLEANELLLQLRSLYCDGCTKLAGLMIFLQWVHNFCNGCMNLEMVVPFLLTH